MSRFVDREFERLRSLLYLQGVLPALSEFLQWRGLQFPAGSIHFRAPGCLRGVWPVSLEASGPTSPRILCLHFPRHREVARFFENGWAIVLPGAGFWRIGALFALSRTGRGMREAMLDPEAPVAIRMIQLRLLLRCASLLDAARPGREMRATSGCVRIILDAGDGTLTKEAWAGFDDSGALIWGGGRPLRPPSAQLRLTGQPLLNRLFSGALIGEEAVARGEVRMEGNIPLIQRLNLVFEEVEHYIPPL